MAGANTTGGELILRGLKTIEYRTRPTKLIGERFYIYAAGKKVGGQPGRVNPRSLDPLALGAVGIAIRISVGIERGSLLTNGYELLSKPRLTTRFLLHTMLAHPQRRAPGKMGTSSLESTIRVCRLALISVRLSAVMRPSLETPNRSFRHPGGDMNVFCNARAMLASARRWGYALGTMVVLLLCGSAVADVPSPTVTGPIPTTVMPGNPAHDYPFFATNHDLAGHGYIEQEFFMQGTANRYNTPSVATGSIIDGGHPYTTRIIVRRPADPKRFNGTVLVEWLNVTNGFDADNVWFFAWEHVLRAGYAWVGVSAQHIGVDRLKVFSPTRYGSLNVTNNDGGDLDAYSYDIYSQAAQAIRHPTGVDVLGGLGPQLVIATGESQSASRLSTYVNSIDPITPVYDGFLLLSSLGNQIRTDLRVPVWKVLTEWDVGALEAKVRQPDTSLFHTWEIAGTSHVDYHLRLSREPLELRDMSTTMTASSAEAILAPQCQVPNIGTRVPTQYVLASAYDKLVTWVTKGTPPPSAPRIETSGSPPTIVRDSLGLALGGIRLSQLAVPTGYNSGFNVGPGACVRWGYFIPFDIPLLDQLYPNQGTYVSAVQQVTKNNLQNGYILKPDADFTNQDAVNSAIGKLDNPQTDLDKPLADFDRNP